MNTFSLCMIVKDEEKVIERCLKSVKDLFDEIIIVDTGSTDKTKEIVKKYTNKVYDFKWVDDFSKARNFSFSKATKKYIMWLDADDVVFEKDLNKLKELKKTLDDSIDIVMMNYDISFDENMKPTFSYYRERLFKRSKKYKWVDPIHEVIQLTGKVIHKDISISHMKEYQNDPDRNIRIFENIIKNGSKLSARQKFYYARELYYKKRFNESITLLEKFIDDKDGWIENKISACLDLAKCYKEIKQPKNRLETLFKSFTLDLPRAEICCEIGSYYMDQSDYHKAIFWYEIAKKCPLDSKSGGFYLIDCYDFIPNLQLCVCYDKLGDTKKSIYYNDEAGKIKPNNPSYLYNCEYFKNLNSNKK